MHTNSFVNNNRNFGIIKYDEKFKKKVNANQLANAQHLMVNTSKYMRIFIKVIKTL